MKKPSILLVPILVLAASCAAPEASDPATPAPAPVEESPAVEWAIAIHGGAGGDLEGFGKRRSETSTSRGCAEP